MPLRAEAHCQRHRLRVVLLAGFTIAAFIFVRLNSVPALNASCSYASESAVPSSPKLVPLRGPPTDHFRDNLLEGTHYITTWTYSTTGWTNNVIVNINLIYLALLTNRIPILPKFLPSAHTPGATLLPFSEVFDLPRLRDAIGVHVLEWADVKNPGSTFIESVGCWSTLKAQFGLDPQPALAAEPDHLDISFTSLPNWIKKFDYPSSYFGDIARFAYPQTRNQNLADRVPSLRNVSLPPDEQLLCFDALYYVCVSQSGEEFDWDYTPQWNLVGQHMHWTPDLSRLAKIHLNRAFGLRDTDENPPYIAIHARREDFDLACGGYTLEECFSSISVISRRVEEVRQELRDRRGLDVQHVVMTSDEWDPEWWDQVIAKGWTRIHHTEILERHGVWYPVLVDAVIQSGAIGFVGTDRSTMSILARRRAETWHNAVSRTVKWGNPTADDR
ncbi:hypothetical protein CPB85DRAFT_1017159 [Mucidula mucida]|nr:hypothetical protein CPB85DRAFT_1017159 [Mucidula mucida]